MESSLPAPDVYGVLTVLVQIESDLRLLANHPTRYAPNGHYETLVNLTTLLQAEVQAWLQTTPGDQRHGQRRQGLARRTTDDRRTGPDRRDAPEAHQA